MATFQHCPENLQVNSTMFETECDVSEEEKDPSSGCVVKKCPLSQTDAQESTNVTTIGHVKRGTDLPINHHSQSNDQFFFSNMLRSLIPKSRQLPSAVKKCRFETHVKRKVCDVANESRKLKCPSNEYLKRGPCPSKSSFDPLGSPPEYSPWWLPLNFPWLWPSTDLHVPCWMSPRLWSSLPSSSILSSGQGLLGKLCRDVPIGELWLHQPHHLNRQGAATAPSPFLLRRPEKRWHHQKLLSAGRKIRPHHSSAFGVPEKLLTKVPLQNGHTELRGRGLDPCCSPHAPTENCTEKPKPNIHYVMHNLQTIFSDIQSDNQNSHTVTSIPPPLTAATITAGDDCFNHLNDQQNSHENDNLQEDLDHNHYQQPQQLLDKNTQTSPCDSSDCKNFSALIGLEIVVDYVKRNDKNKINSHSTSK